MSAETGAESPSSPQVEDDWLIRPCKIYEEEYSDCTSIRARFNQYFIFGKAVDCAQWKRDCDNCYRWEEQKNIKAGKEVVASEKVRRKERLNAHYNNTVWERRRTPPDNWNSPLPEHMQRDYELSYLNIKAKEMRGEIPPTIDSAGFCVVM